MNRKTSRILRHFQQNPGFRSEWISQISQNFQVVSEVLSAIETVAVVAIWSLTQPVDEAIHRIEQLCSQNWFRQNKDDFYEQLVQTVLEFERKGLDEEASDLTMMGEKIAEVYQDRGWATRYRELTERKLGKRIGDLPFLKQRGW